MDYSLLTFEDKNIIYDQISWLNLLDKNKNCKIKHLCQLPYPKHPNGCPNYNKNLLCPPYSPYLKLTLKKYEYFKLFLAHFDFIRYEVQMKVEHPKWTQGQITCILYYQNWVKSHFYEHVLLYVSRNSLILGCGSGFGDKMYSMESVGINVFQTLKNINFSLEIKPIKQITFVSLLCSHIPIKQLQQTTLF